MNEAETRAEHIDPALKRMRAGAWLRAAAPCASTPSRGAAPIGSPQYLLRKGVDEVPLRRTLYRLSSGQARTIRGGSWADRPFRSTSAFRLSYNPAPRPGRPDHPSQAANHGSRVTYEFTPNFLQYCRRKQLKQFAPPCEPRRGVKKISGAF